MTSPQSAPEAATLLAKFHLRSGAEREFTAWQAQALTRAAGFEGFLNSEITPAATGQGDWTVALRFRGTDNLNAWRQSPTWRSLIGQAQGFLAKNHAAPTEKLQ